MQQGYLSSLMLKQPQGTTGRQKRLKFVYLRKTVVLRSFRSLFVHFPRILILSMSDVTTWRQITTFFFLSSSKGYFNCWIVLVQIRSQWLPVIEKSFANCEVKFSDHTPSLYLLLPHSFEKTNKGLKDKEEFWWKADARNIILVIFLTIVRLVYNQFFVFCFPNDAAPSPFGHNESFIMLLFYRLRCFG